MFTTAGSTRLTMAEKELEDGTGSGTASGVAFVPQTTIESAWPKPAGNYRADHDADNQGRGDQCGDQHLAAPRPIHHISYLIHLSNSCLSPWPSPAFGKYNTPALPEFLFPLDARGG